VNVWIILFQIFIYQPGRAAIPISMVTSMVKAEVSSSTPARVEETY